MTRVWSHLFIPACFALGIGLLLMVWAVMQPYWITFIVLVVVLAFLLILLFDNAMPRLGTDD